MPPVSVWLLPVLAAWIVPGAGHFMLKRAGRGALLFGSVLLMFLFGLFMRGMMFTPEKGADYLSSLINYGGFACNLAADSGNTVALVDLDLALGDADVALDIMPDHTLADLAMNIDKLDLNYMRRSLLRHGPAWQTRATTSRPG